MPQMSGPELVDKLQAARPELEVLFLSGYSAETVRLQALRDGAAFLQKPFDDVALLQRIRGLLDATERATISGATGDAREPA